MMQVYLFPFETPVAHAQHYLGSTKNLAFRMKQHLRGEGSPLVKAALDAGILVHLAATWEGGRDLERAFAWRTTLKRRQNSPKLCPICQAKVHIHELMGGEGGAP